MSEVTPPTGIVAGIIRYCLDRRLLVFLLAIALTVGGLVVAPFDWEILGLPRHPVAVDAIPDIGENQQIVFTEWPGRSPRDVDDQITYPLTVALLGVPGVKTVRSQSMFGYSSIYIVFNDDIEFYWSRSRVLERLSSLPRGTLPEGVQPALGPDATALGQVYWYTLEGRDPDGKPVGGWGLDELRSVQDFHVRYHLLAADGVAEVASVGGFVREYQIDVDPDAMRAFGVTLDQVFDAVRKTNAEVGARTIEVNRVEYIVRGVGYIRSLDDIRQTVVKVMDNTPITIAQVATVSLGPQERRGALDNAGAEAVGGVVVVRYGENPLAVIKRVKEQVASIKDGMPAKAFVDWDRASRDEVESFAAAQGFAAFTDDGSKLSDAWMPWLRTHPRAEWPKWATISKLTIQPFYDRTGLIHETIGTLDRALTEEILVTIIVVVVMVMHLRSSLLISFVMPLGVLVTFLAMKAFHVDANIVALSGIAIAIGTMVDMGIILCENLLKHLEEAPLEESRVAVVHRATAEVGSAVLTAVATTVLGFLPVFAMTGAEGKLFRPLAFTKTFALLAALALSLTVVPVAAYWIIAARVEFSKIRRRVLMSILFGAMALLVAAPAVGALANWWPAVAWVTPTVAAFVTAAAAVVLVIAVWHMIRDRVPVWVRKASPIVINMIAVLVVGGLLVDHWLPLGPQAGFVRNFVFVAVLMGGLLVGFHFFQFAYGPILRWALANKLLFLSLPGAIAAFGIVAWLGFDRAAPVIITLVVGGLAMLVIWRVSEPGRAVLLTPAPRRAWLYPAALLVVVLIGAGIWLGHGRVTTGSATMATSVGTAPDHVRSSTLWVDASAKFPGLGQQFMPALDEGSFLWMPSTMPHASIGAALDVVSRQDEAIRAIPEVDSVVGKIGRVDSSLDPAPIGMLETVVNYKPEFMVDASGDRLRFRYDDAIGAFERDAQGELIPDSSGRPYRQWRDFIHTPDDIWREIVRVAALPQTTSASKLQPIETRLLMLQSGIRSRFAVKVTGPDLETIEAFGLRIEKLLQAGAISGIDTATVIADRIVGTPYLEIDIDRLAIQRYGMQIQTVQDAIEVAIGGRPLTTTVEGRERYPVRVRYQRELRDSIEAIGRILVASADGTQVPLTQLAKVRYVRGPQMIRSEDTFRVGYVMFDSKPGYAEVDIKNQTEAYLHGLEETGQLIRPAGVNYDFTGTYENQIHASQTLRLILPLALLAILIVLYAQFRSMSTTLIVFSGIGVAWAGGFVMLWLYGQDWFLDMSVFGSSLRDVFQVKPVLLSTAVWVGFLALFGIASDDGVVIATYLDQSFEKRKPESIREVRDAVLAAGKRRVRPCLMTTATTILALLPVLTSTGRGADVMAPMAIPTFGGMTIELLTMFVVPVLYCMIAEGKLAMTAEPASAS